MPGVTVGLVALPLAMAFAIASGVPPQAGLYCAVVAGFLISALGGSNTQIGGPTGAFVVVVYGIVSRYGIDGLYMCTLLAGLMLVVLGATGLGTAVKFIPRPVVVGFTNGIAVLIASTQIKDFFGLQTGPVPGDFLGRMETLAQSFRTLSLTETSLGVLGIVIDPALHAIRETHPRICRGAVCRNRSGLGLQTSSRNDRHTIWRDTFRSSRPSSCRPSGWTSYSR